MDLLNLDEIKQGLDQKFLPLEPILRGLRLISGGVSEEMVALSENQLGIKFPDAFRETIKAFDFGRLTIGPIVFCNTGDYLQELAELNIQARWWGDNARPENLLMIANSDPYSVLLDLKADWVLAMDMELGWQRATIIAKEFDAYLRGVGTIMLRRNQTSDTSTLAQIVMAEVGGTDIRYWSQLAR